MRKVTVAHLFFVVVAGICESKTGFRKTMRESRSGLSAEITSNGRVKMESCLGYSAERNFVKRSQLKCKDVPSHHVSSSSVNFSLSCNYYIMSFINNVLWNLRQFESYNLVKK